MKNTKTIITIAIVTLAVAIFASLASAESWACLSKGQKLNFCNPSTPDRTCGSSTCMYCIATYDSVNNCYNQGNFNTCNSIAPECTMFDNSSIDSVPPVLNLINPVDQAVYTERSIGVNFTLDERSDVFFMDTNDQRRVTRLCNGCMTHGKKRSFKEGINNITFIAVDASGNSMQKVVKFFIDSQVPKVSKTSPKKGFAPGKFQVEFKEDNPVLTKLVYGNSNTGTREAVVDTDQCTVSKGKYKCNITADLSDYHNETISYWFEVKDIANNIGISKPIALLVDSVDPVIEDLDTEQDGGSLMLRIVVTEENFDSIKYRDNSASRPSWKNFCSRLNSESACEKKISFAPGVHDIDIFVYDEAGNSASRNIDISV